MTASNDRDSVLTFRVTFQLFELILNLIVCWVVDFQSQHFLRDFETYSDDFEILFVHNAANKRDKGTAYTRTLQLQPATDHHRDQLKC